MGAISCKKVFRRRNSQWIVGPCGVYKLVSGHMWIETYLGWYKEGPLLKKETRLSFCHYQVHTPGKDGKMVQKEQGSQAPQSFWKLPVRPRISPNFPGSSLATSPERLQPWLYKGNPASFPDFPGSSPDFPRGQPPVSGKPDNLWWVKNRPSNKLQGIPETCASKFLAKKEFFSRLRVNPYF